MCSGTPGGSGHGWSACRCPHGPKSSTRSSARPCSGRVRASPSAGPTPMSRCASIPTSCARSSGTCVTTRSSMPRRTTLTAPSRYDMVGDFQERAGVRDHPAISYLDGAVRVVLRGMLERVVTQVPEDLAQLVGIDAHLDIGVGPADGEARTRPLHGLAELRVELFGPCGQRQALQPCPLPPGVPLHIV